MLVTPECKDLIQKLLVLDVNQRLSADEAYAHQWIAFANQGSE